MKLDINEVKEPEIIDFPSEIEERKTIKKRKISIQKIFNVISFLFILGCCIYYGSRFIKLYLENNRSEETKVLIDIIKDNNVNNENFKNINGDYYFTGESSNNYLRYSNLIWRIIRINSNNTVTLVLDNSITALASGELKNYSNSYLNYWLNSSEQEYTGILENNLNNVTEYLTYTYTCNDIVDDTKNISCKETVNDMLITIPSINDYVNTGGNNGFMNNEEYFYLINSNQENKLWYVNNEGEVETTDGTDIMGIRPVITIKNTIELINGDGSKDNPYTIEKENALFASYVKLGEDIWRIYSIDNDNVKLVLDTYAEINGSDIKYKYSNNGYYHDDTKNNSLAYYLKNTYLPTLSYSNLINEVEYSNGIYSTTDYDYVKVLKTKVNTKIATLSIGDIFLNSSNTNYYTSTGLSEDSNLVYVISNNFKLSTKESTENLRIIPVISINKNLLTIGDGTLEKPLEVKYE